MSVKKIFLLIVVLFIVMPSLWAQPMKKIPIGGPRKSCGRDLVARVDRICQSRGGHMTYTGRARRVKRGIVEECCANKCSDHHIYAYCSKSSDADSSIESPIPIEVMEPKFHEVRSVPEIQPEIATEAPVERVTPDTPQHYRYNDIYVKDNVNADFVEQIIKSLPHHSNDFQVGTVPPEFRSSRYIPSRVRISNY